MSRPADRRRAVICTSHSGGSLAYVVSAVTRPEKICEKLSATLVPRKISGAIKQAASSTVIKEAASVMRLPRWACTQIKAGHVLSEKIRASIIAGIKGRRTMKHPIRPRNPAVRTISRRYRETLSMVSKFMK